MSFIHLILNENMKIYHKRSTWEMLGISFASILAILLLYTISSQRNTNYWDTVFGLFQTENQILYLIMIIIASQIVSSEFSSGTAKLLFIRPMSRIQIMFAKLFASIILSVVILITNLLSCFLAASFFHSFEPISDANLYQLLLLVKIKFFTFFFYSILFFTICLFTKKIVLSLIMGIVLMGSLQSLPSMMIFPQTSFLISSVIWSIFCISILVGSFVHFKRSDI